MDGFCALPTDGPSEFGDLLALPNGAHQVIIADGDASIHARVRSAIDTLCPDRQLMSVRSAYSCAETLTLLGSGKAAVLLIDAHLDAEKAGLDVVEQVYASHGTRVRTIVWSAEPDHLCERTLVRRCGIDALLPRHGFDADQLGTVLLRCLRHHAELAASEANQQAMSRLISAVANLFDAPTLRLCQHTCLTQMQRLLGATGGGIFYHQPLEASPNRDGPTQGPVIAAATGRFRGQRGRSLSDLTDPDVGTLIGEALEQGGVVRTGDRLAAVMDVSGIARCVAYLEGTDALSMRALQMVDILRDKAAIALASHAHRGCASPSSALPRSTQPVSDSDPQLADPGSTTRTAAAIQSAQRADTPLPRAEGRTGAKAIDGPRRDPEHRMQAHWASRLLGWGTGSGAVPALETSPH